MVGALGTLTIEAFATGYYGRAHQRGIQSVNVDEEKERDMHMQLQSHSHGHVHGHGGGSTAPEGLSELDRVKYKVTSQVDNHYLAPQVHACVVLFANIASVFSPPVIYMFDQNCMI